ncbi:phage tail sheath C-terminal domain-containing protein [uncultured Cellulomonas sp.]|uniref:phage tail sheath family protein n=1 Tax=uncultured Cellulomonas sp. TaxID=189682 RepID=UPI00261A6FE5|nr:phage tail sheath C-terminal domain-containing protein [uncultured Cellulomonas sp.]
MAERLTPGVYVEEVQSGVKPIQAVPTSTAGFIGEAPRGVPGTATFVRGFADFERAFGGHRRGAAGHLAQAVEAFFAAGGSRAFVVRVLPDDAVAGVSDDVLARSDDVWGGDRRVLRVTARGAGAWAENLRVHVGPSTSSRDRAFALSVEWVEGGRGRVVERFDDVVLDPESPEYVVEVVDDLSRYIRVTDLHRTEFLDAEPRLDPPLPDRAPRLVTHEGDVEVPLGGRLALRWTGPEGVGGDGEVVFDDAAVTTAGGTVGDDGRFALLDRAQLLALLQAQLGADFTVVDEDPVVTVGAPVATDAYLVAPVAGGTDTVELGGTATLTLTATDAEGNGPLTVVLDTDPLGATPLPDLVEALREQVATADLDDLLEIGTAGPRLVVSTRTPRAEGTRLALAVDAGTPFDAAADRPGAAGVVVEDLGAVTVVATETLEPGRLRALPTVFTAARDTGLRESSALNPDLRPAQTGDTPLRLRGGTDGAEVVSPADFAGREDATGRTGLRAFDDVDIQLLLLPGRNEPDFLATGMAYADRRGVFYVADGVGSDDRRFAVDTGDVVRFVEGLPTRSDNVAMFYPWIEVTDPVGVGRAPRRMVPPSGHVAGVFARTDRTRGVWKAPAGLEATIPGALDLQHRLLDADQDLLNPIGLCCLRQRPGAGIVSWGARTLSSDPEWRYTNVRRTGLFLMESLRRGLQWVVFEPNDVTLWGRVRGTVEAFMLGLHRQGAFQGATPGEAFAVKCDAETNPQELIDQGIVTVQVAFAPLKPAEFVVVQISQKTLLAA